ncbi:MAG: hypothetical protein GXP48_11640 [Acidobacteria bacterium]|nr:hypothetical protein [Acidobacteriota bacterium]
MLHRCATRSVAAQAGTTLPEIVIVLGLFAMMTAIAAPALTSARRAAALARATTHIHAMMRCGHSRAILRQQTEALVFERPNGVWRCFLAEDGDGDGVRHDDIRRGRDRIVGEIFELDGGGAGLGILQRTRIPDPSGRGWLGGNLGDPVRAGRGDIITFTNTGTATPSSIYFTNGADRMRVLRIYGPTGAVRELEWRRGWPAWRAAR